MDAQTIRTALGELQAVPDSEQAWSTLKGSVEEPAGDLAQEELLRLLDAACEKHAGRAEWYAVARLLELELGAARDTAREAEIAARLARVLEDEMFDDEGATRCWTRVLEIDPENTAARMALGECEGRRERKAELAARYLSEAEQAPDDVYKSSMLMRAAEMDVRFAGRDANLESAIEWLEQAVRLDPTNERAGRLLEHVYRKRGSWEELARVLERLADRSESAASRIASGVRLSRLYSQHLSDSERAALAYDRVLRLAPEHAEAKSFLSEFYASEGRWSDLVALYERELRGKDSSDADRLGDMLQIAMLHWRKLERPQDAEPWFERIRKVDPTNEGMLAFYREYYKSLEDDTRLIEVLQGAQRALPDGRKEKRQLATEIARLAEGTANAQKAIEQYKSVLRQDPGNGEAREALKRLYKQTQGYNALVELLRQELERTPTEQYAARIGILREVATVYRQYLKSDTALLSVLNQIVQLDDKLDEHDVDEMRELVSLYDKHGRHRDLITHQLKLAEITPDVEEKKDLYRKAARRWLDQFQNVQNAADAYAALLAVAPGDAEARGRLEELYRKRRSWDKLYELYAADLKLAEGGAKLSLLREMAELAADRLNRGSDAIALYKQILELDPGRAEVIESLEKQAERAKDWATLAETLELDVASRPDEAGKLGALQRLGSVYAEHLGDRERAAKAWQRVLELQPGHTRALRVLRESYLEGGDYDGLEKLYALSSDWEGLAEVMSNAADRAKDAPQRVQLSYRAARIYEGNLAQPERAVRSYERILAADPSDVRAASALVPLYEKDEKWARLPGLYELLGERAESDEQKLELLGKLVDVTGKRLNDRKVAVQHARKAYELAPDSELALGLFEGASRAAGSWDAFVQALEARLTTNGASPAAPEERAQPAGKKGKKKKRGDGPAEGQEPKRAGASPERRRLELMLARVFSEELGRSDDAVAVYRRMLDRDPADADAQGELETILRREDRRDDLRWLLELRVEHAPSEFERAKILGEWATLEEDVFDSKTKAVELYRRMLEMDPPEPAALVALPRLLLAADDAAGAAQVIERHRDRLDGDARAEREVELAELYLSRLNRPADAVESAVRALESESSAGRAMSVLERLVEVPSVRGRAAGVLAREFEKSGEARREAQALGVLLAETTDPGERLELYQRLASVHEKKLSAYGSALDVMLEAVRRYPNEIELWDRAEALAVQAGRPTDLAESFREVLRGNLPDGLRVQLCERAARLHEDKLGDPKGAIPYLEQVLEHSPSDVAAFQRLKDILTAAERWGALETLYDRASQATTDRERRTEMLVEVALICEEIIEDPAKAITYYERILEDDAFYDVSIRALDRLYARQGRDKDLAALLEKRLTTASGDDLFELKLRLAKLDLDLHEPEKAIGHVEDVLLERVNDYQARELAERMLQIGELRVRAASMLEAVYEARDEIRDLVRVLEIRLESLGSDPAQSERRELLRRIATLRDERLHDDESASRTLGLLVPADPADADARARLLEIGRRLGSHENVAEVLSAAAERAELPELCGEILMQVASVYLDLLHDSERAERVYRRVLGLDEEDAGLVLPAARALERIYLASGDSAKLAEMLRIQVKFEADAGLRRELLGRLGELCQGVLADNDGAIAAWKERAELDPEDDRALAALDRLYETTERYRDLVDVLERRREIASDFEERRALLTRVAETQWKRLGAVPSAIESYQLLSRDFGATGSVLGALEALFAEARRWEELAETLERHLAIAADDAERLTLLARLGDLQREHLGEVLVALEAYRRALAIDPKSAPSRAALEQVLDSEDAVARREAASILHPIYEAEGEHEKLIRVVDIEVATTDDPIERLSGYETAMRVAENRIGDAKRAFGYAERAVRLAVGHSELEPWFENLERLSAATGQKAEYVKLLCDVAPEIFDGDVQLEVTLRIADLARHQLADRDLAREYYKRALDQRADDRHALSALESLYDEAGDAKNLLGILERRVEIAESDAERKELLFRRARLLSEVIGDKRRAIEVYESVLDLGLDRAAISALEALYAEVGMWPELVGLYERQLGAGLGNAAELHVNIASVVSRHQHDLGRAFDELEAALRMDRQHPRVIAELERILAEVSDPEARARAASLLEPVYLIRSDFGRVMEAIRARLAYVTDPDQRRELLLRLAKLYEEQTENYRAALDTMAELFAEDISDADTVAELERLAKVAGAERRLAEVYATALDKTSADDDATLRLLRRTGALFAELGDLERALGFYRRALSLEPESTALFDAIDEILKRTARHEERVTLYRDTLDHRFDPRERLALLHTIARLEQKELGRPDAAIDTYRAVLDYDESDPVALDALTDLYRERERFDDLGELYLRRAEFANDPAAAALHRLALARLQIKLDNPERALDQLEEVVRELPSHPEALAELEALRKLDDQRRRVVDILRPIYESLDDWRHQIALNEDRYALARDNAERVSVLRETAELWERRGNDLGRALRAFEAALKLDPDDGDVRSEYERLAQATGEWDRLAETYEGVLEAAPALSGRREILATLARVHNEWRDDPRRALAAYDRLFELEPSDIEPLQKMEPLATLLSDWPTLVRVLTAKAELLLDDAERASVWRRVGEAKRDMLEDPSGAIVAYERAFELEPDSAFTADCLIDLYEARRDSRRLVELYQRRVELADDEDNELKYKLLVSAAACFEHELSDNRRAIDVFCQALLQSPGDAAVLAALNRLYRAEAMWPELLDNLRLEMEQLAAPDVRAERHKEIGAILAQKLANFEDALEAYRLGLVERPGDPEAIAAVRAIGSDNEELRGRVAEILVPVLSHAGRYEDLVDVFELRFSVETEPTARMETLTSIATVLETRLGRTADAQTALLRALAERPDAAELHSEIERLARAADGFARYADALGERAQSIFDPEVAEDLYVRLGRVAEQCLHDDERAVQAYLRALEQSGDRAELLEALDRLYTRLGRLGDLADVLERRVVVERSERVQAELYFRLAELQVDRFSEPARALSSLRHALERAPDHERAVAQLEKLTQDRDLFEEAAEILESVYRGRGQTENLAALYEKRVSHADGATARADMRRNLARVLENECGDPRAAQRAIEQGLLENPSDPVLLAEVERLARLTSGWDRAAAALSSALASTPDLVAETAVELAVRLAGWQRDHVRDPAAAEAALRRALEFDPNNDDVLVLLEDLLRVPGRERDLAEVLRRRAQLLFDEQRREELYQKAKALADSIGDSALGESLLRELLEQDDTNLWALAELTALSEAAGNFRETYDLLVRRSELRADPEIARGLKRKAALIARDKLQNPDDAVQLYSQLFDDDPNDSDASSALRSLYTSGGRFQELAHLLARLVDLAESPAERSGLRMELSRLSEERFQSPDTAIELLRAVLDDEPGRSDAVVALSRLYEDTKRDEDLADLLSSQIEFAASRGDVAAELTFEVRLGQIYDSRLADRQRAIDTYRSVLRREPQHKEALQALSRLLQAEKRMGEAAEVIEQLLLASSGDEAVALALELSRVQLELGSPEGAISALERGLGAMPRHPELNSRLSALYESHKEWDKLSAQLATNAEHAATPEASVELLRRAATIQASERQDHAKAAELLDRATHFKPGDRELLLALCDEYSASGRARQASEVLLRIVESYGAKRSKELAEIHRRLASAYLADKDPQKALEELDKAFRIEPGNISVLTLLGEVALDVGDFKKAQQMFRALLLQKLDERGPIKKATVFYRLGQIHEKLGEAPKAVQMYERAVQTEGGQEEAKERLAALKGR